MTAPNSLVAQTLIETIIGSNSSWAQGISEMGLLSTFDWELDLPDSLYAEGLAEQLDIDTDEAANELRTYICQNRLWSAEQVAQYMPDVLRIGMEYGGLDEIVDSIKDFAEREEAPEVVSALEEAAVGHDYEEELLEAIRA